MNNEFADPNEGINAIIKYLKNLPQNSTNQTIKWKIETIEDAIDNNELSRQTLNNIRIFSLEMQNEVEIKKNEIQDLMRILINKPIMKDLVVDRNFKDSYYEEPYLSDDIKKTIPYFYPIQRTSAADASISFQNQDCIDLFNNITIIKDIKTRMIYYIEQYIIKLQADYNELHNDIKKFQRLTLPNNRNNPNSAHGLPSHIKSRYAGNTSGSPLDPIINSMMESAEEINRELQHFYGRLNNLGYDNNNYNMDKQIRQATFAQQRKNRKGGKSKKKSYKKSRKRNKTKYRKRKH